MFSRLLLDRRHPVAVSTKELPEKIDFADFTPEIITLSEYLQNCFEAEEPTQLCESTLFERTPNEILRGMQLAATKIKNARIERQQPRIEPLEWRQMVLRSGKELPTHLRQLLEWIATVRIALLDSGPTGRKIKYDICGRCAATYQFRFDCLTDTCQITGEAPPLVVLEPINKSAFDSYYSLELRWYATSVDNDGDFVLGTKANCLRVRNLWWPPAVKSVKQLEQLFIERKKPEPEIQKMLGAILRQRAAVRLPEDFYLELRGREMDLENLPRLNTVIALLEALIADVVIERKNEYLGYMAAQAGYDIDTVASVFDAIESGDIGDDDEDAATFATAVMEKVGDQADEFARHLAVRNAAKAKRRASTMPFDFAEPYLAFTVLPDTIDSAVACHTPVSDARLVSGEYLASRSDRELLLRNSRLIRVADPRRKAGLVPQVFLGFGSVIEVCGVKNNTMWHLLPQVFSSGVTTIPVSALRGTTPSMRYAISREDMPWRKRPAGNRSNSKKDRVAAT